jgi:DNA repair photolyase
MEKKVRSINPESVKKIFSGSLTGDYSKLSQGQKQFIPYIQNKKIIQWGGLSDQFDEFERRHGITLEVLKFFDKIDYPISFSTKAVWWTEDERYMELFSRHAHNWHVKMSIITDNKDQALKLEKGCPSPEERMKAIKNLSSLGINVTLRLRPFIIGASESYNLLLEKACGAGANSVSTEFFCLESRADEDLKKRYKGISDGIGYDVLDYYIKNSHQHGYKRLSREIKVPIIRSIRDKAHSLGMRFHCSDMFCREWNDGVNCCGVPPEWNSQIANFNGAIQIAKQKGKVYFSDIKKDLDKIFHFQWLKAQGFNTTSNKARAVLYNINMCDYFRYKWNGDSGSSPCKGYGNILMPCGKDKNGDIIYRYNERLSK